QEKFSMLTTRHLFVYVFGLAVFGCLAAFVVASEWEDKPYTEWSREATIAMLTHSPWASREVVYEESSVGDSSAGGSIVPGENNSNSSGSQSGPAGGVK